MRFAVFAVLVGIPLLEIAIFIEVGEVIGLWPTIGLVVLTAMAGTALLRSQGLATLKRANELLARREFPVAEVFHGVCLLLAGALLLTPGLLTDAAGLLLFIPAVRRAMMKRGWGYLRARGRADFVDDSENRRTVEDDVTIETEFHEVGPERGDDRPAPRLTDTDTRPPGKGKR
jgi:UPF0716 protein FxsA